MPIIFAKRNVPYNDFYPTDTVALRYDYSSYPEIPGYDIKEGCTNSRGVIRPYKIQGSFAECQKEETIVSDKPATVPNYPYGFISTHGTAVVEIDTNTVNPETISWISDGTFDDTSRREIVLDYLSKKNNNGIAQYFAPESEPLHAIYGPGNPEYYIIGKRYCDRNPGAPECACYERHLSSDYSSVKKSDSTVDDICWWKPCQAANVFLPELVGTRTCPTLAATCASLTVPEGGVEGTDCGKSLSICETDPGGDSCCGAYPDHPSCIISTTCEIYPGSNACCTEFPDHPSCIIQTACDTDPGSTACCTEFPDHLSCVKTECETNPGSTACCTEFPDNPSCVKTECDTSPGSTECCTKYPSDKSCITPMPLPTPNECVSFPGSTQCCTKYPTDPSCVKTECDTSPGSTECCTKYPSDKSCITPMPPPTVNECTTSPGSIECCIKYPDNSSCKNSACNFAPGSTACCTEFPEHKSCNDPLACVKYPGSMACCTQFPDNITCIPTSIDCTTNPGSYKCCKNNPEHPSCVKDPHPMPTPDGPCLSSPGSIDCCLSNPLHESCIPPPDKSIFLPIVLTLGLVAVVFTSK